MRASRRPRSISIALAWFVLAASSAVASPASDAEPTGSSVAAYREAVDRGTAAFVARRFADARHAFGEAFAMHPDPVLVFNIASCWRRAGHAAEALAEYRRFLTLAPSDDARRMLAEETIAALEAERAPAPPPVIEVDDRPMPARSIWRPIGLSTTGLGAVGLTIGIVELVRARSLASESVDDSSDWDGRDGSWDGQHDGQWNGARDGPGDGQRDGDGDRDGDSHGGGQDGGASERAKRRALVFGASGAAVMTAGVIMYVIGRRSERALRVTASASSGGGQVVLGGRF